MYDSGFTKSSIEELVQYIKKRKPKSLVVSKNNFDKIVEQMSIQAFAGSDRIACVIESTFILSLFNQKITDSYILEQTTQNPPKSYSLEDFMINVKNVIGTSVFSILGGATCGCCSQFYPYSDAEDGFICWSCRNGA